jgi:hypothetical protein
MDARLRLRLVVRMLRVLARDVEPGYLYGCDPVRGIRDICRDTRVPGVLARSEFIPETLRFAQRFDLADAFSVFTHLSERAYECCLRALHAGLVPGGTLIVTVRPIEYLRFDASMHRLLAEHAARLQVVLTLRAV